MAVRSSEAFCSWVSSAPASSFGLSPANARIRARTQSSSLPSVTPSLTSTAKSPGRKRNRLTSGAPPGRSPAGRVEEPMRLSTPSRRR